MLRVFGSVNAIKNPRLFYLGILVLFLVQPALSQRVVKTVSISEPAAVTVENLYKRADVVALVKIVSGDSENFSVTMYKATVLDGYKGVKDNETIYFGPHISYGVGSEYYVFLTKDKKKIGEMISEEKGVKPPSFDRSANYLSIMHEGYSVLDVSYECAFEIKQHFTDSCDYAVRINTFQVILPDTLKVYQATVDENSDEKFVKKQSFEDLIKTLKGNKQ